MSDRQDEMNKRFVTNGYKIYDNYTNGREWLVNNVDAMEIVKVMNNLDMKARERSKALSKLQRKYDELKKENNAIKLLEKKNEELRKQIHLVHMAGMFSTVKSFKGDVSKRYQYSNETDTIFDTANNYGSYDKILDKKEITMLLNEYETVLKELSND